MVSGTLREMVSGTLRPRMVSGTLREMVSGALRVRAMRTEERLRRAR